MALNILTGLATNIDTVLSELDTIGFFRYILPLLLIFAIVFAILSKIKILEDRTGVNFIISMSIALLAVINPTVSNFFAILFPDFARGISILLVSMILIGVFVPLGQEEGKEWGWGNYIFMGIGILIFLVVALNSLNKAGFAGSWWWDRYMGAIIVLLIIAGAVIAVITAKKKEAGTVAAAPHH